MAGSTKESRCPDNPDLSTLSPILSFFFSSRASSHPFATFFPAVQYFRTVDRSVKDALFLRRGILSINSRFITFTWRGLLEIRETTPLSLPLLNNDFPFPRFFALGSERLYLYLFRGVNGVREVDREERLRLKSFFGINSLRGGEMEGVEARLVSFFVFQQTHCRVSSRATTSWKLRGDTSWGVNECPRRCNLASINPSAGRRDVRPYDDVSLIDVHEATSKQQPHLRRPLHEFPAPPPPSPPSSPFSFSLLVNRFFSADSIFIYLFLSEGWHRHRDTLASS